MSAPNGSLPLVNGVPDDNLYGYVPTRSICILFVVLFALSTVIHIAQMAYSRLWWLSFTVVLAGLAEFIGWIGRLQSSSDPTKLDPFLMQITTTIIAPTPLIAANFVILGQLIKRLGQQYSRLNAIWYTVVFCSCDIIALIIQAVGGAQASTALQEGEDPNPGGNVMLGGIAFQLAAVCVYLILAIEFLFRYAQDRPLRGKSESRSPLDTRGKFMVLGLALDGLFILIRSIYRTIELNDGWSGTIITTQVYFNVFDGAMIVLAMYTLNICHPGLLLGKANVWHKLRGPSARPTATLPKSDPRKSATASFEMQPSKTPGARKSSSSTYV